MFANLKQKLDPSGFILRYYLVTFASGLMFYISVLVPFYTQWGHLNLTQVQLLQSWLMIWLFILNIPTGVVADRFGRKKSISLGGLILSASCIIYVLVPGFYPFLLAEFLSALGTSFVIGAGSALIYDYLKSTNREGDSKKVLGRSSAIGSLGTVIAAPIGSIIAARFGIRAPMLLSAVPLFIASLLILTIKEPSREKAQHRGILLRPMVRGVIFLFANRNLRYIIVNDILVWIGAYFLVWLYQPMLIKVGLAIIYFGVIRAAFSLAGMLATFNLHFTEKLFRSENLFINSTAAIVSGSLLLVAAFPSTITVTVAIILIGGFASARTSYLNTTTNEFIPAEQRATVLSAISTAYTLVFALTNPAIGYIADHSLRLAFLAVGLLPLISLLVLPYRRREPTKESEANLSDGDLSPVVQEAEKVVEASIP